MPKTALLIRHSLKSNPILLLLPLLVGACASPAKHTPVVAPVVVRSFPATIVDKHFIGVFQNDRSQKSLPVVLDLVPIGSSGAAWRMLAVLRIYTDTNKKISAHFPNVHLQGDKITFSKTAKQKIRIVGQGKLHKDGKMQFFAVVYGFGQGYVHLQRTPLQVSNHQLLGGKYPLAKATFTTNNQPFPQQAFAQQTKKHKDDAMLLANSKNLLASNLLTVDYEQQKKLGKFYGILHHERQNSFQYVRLVFENDGLHNEITAISTLFFSLPQQREFIVYRYAVSDKTLRAAVPVIFAGKGENFLKIENWNEEKIEGIWYAKTHGRIGRVYFRRKNFPLLPENAALVQALTGHYANETLACEISVNNRLARNAEIFPAKITGVVREIENDSSFLVTAGSYDFYLGVVRIVYGNKFMSYSLLDKNFSPIFAEQKKTTMPMPIIR